METIKKSEEKPVSEMSYKELDLARWNAFLMGDKHTLRMVRIAARMQAGVAAIKSDNESLEMYEGLALGIESDLTRLGKGS